MKCHSCDFESPEGSKFCGNCGTRLYLICSSCRQPTDPNMKFCTNCGHPIELPINIEKEVKKVEPETLSSLPFLVKKDGEKLSLEKDSMVIGREENCDLVLPSPGISNRHASIEKTDEGYLLTDLGSTNGTYVNGKAISNHLLKEGDRVIIGTENFSFKNNPDGPMPEPQDQPVRPAQSVQTVEPVPPVKEVTPSKPSAPSGPETKEAVEQTSLSPAQVQKLAKKMEKGMPSPVFKSKSLAMVMFSDEKVRWVGTCWSYWNFGANRTRELLIGVTPFRVILYYEAAIGGDACQSYWYDVDFGGMTWKSGMKTWRGFTMAPPELVKKKINLYPQRIDINGKAKTLLMASPLESLKTPTPEKKLKKNPEAFFNVLHQAYENRNAVNPESLLILLNNPLEAPKIKGSAVS